MVAAVVLVGASMRGNVEAASMARPHVQVQDTQPAFYIAGFYDPFGRYCTGLFSDSGQLLSYWNCHYSFGSMAVAAGKRVSLAEFLGAVQVVR